MISRQVLALIGIGLLLPCASDAAGVAPLDPASFLGDEIRVRVETTGIQQILVSDLIAAGLSTGVHRKTVRLYQKRASDPGNGVYPTPLTADVPLHFVGNPDPNDLIDPADVIVFHGFGAQDDASERSIDGDTFPHAMPERPDNFNSANVYWLVAADPAPGTDWARMHTSTLDPSAGSPLPSFRRTERFEGDEGYQGNPLIIAEPRYHWNSDREIQIAREVPVVHPVPGSDLTVTWTLVRGLELPSPWMITCSLAKGGTAYELATIDVATAVSRTLQATSSTLSADLFGDGAADFLMETQSGPFLGAWLGSVTLEYDALYRASSDVASFHTGPPIGDVDVEVAGFLNPDLMLFDVTDPRAPVVIELAAANIVDDDGEFRLSVRVPQSGPDPRQFHGATLSGIPQLVGANLERDVVVDVLVETGPAQALAVGPSEFETSMGAWLNWRRANDLFGWSYAYVDVQQIYDDFSGGLKSPTAIKAFTKYAYDNWTARALVLVGDANENARQIGADATSDHLPSHFHLQSFAGDPPALIPSDKWFVISDTDESYPASLTAGPAMMVGRLPASSQSDLDLMVAKIIAYEQPADDDLWRQRSLWVADDAHSLDILSAGSGCYRYQAAEEAFASSQMASAALVNSALDSSLTGQVQNANDFTESCRAGDICENLASVRWCFAANHAQDFLDQWSQGWLWLSYQGHSAFNVLGHENLALSDSLSQLSNDGRPFVFFGMGSHISDFARTAEGSRGRSIGEQLLSAPAGAVATVGSGAYEFLTPNQFYMELITSNFFDRGRTTGPVLGATELPSQWVLGEALAQSDHDLLNSPVYVYRAEEMMAQFNLLGDPLLRLDAAPPRMALVGDGEPLIDGQKLLPQPGTNSILVDISLVDESGLDRLEIVDSLGRDYSASVVFEPTADPRLLQGTLELLLYSEDYTIEFRAYDGSYPTVRPTVQSFIVQLQIGTDAPAAVARRFALGKARPNPFNPSTEIRFELPRHSHVQLSVFDLAGRRVTTLVDESYDAGVHRVTWNGRDDSGAAVATGVYLYRMEAGGFTATKRMTLVK